jgi:restriction endonuclease S subunit
MRSLLFHNNEGKYNFYDGINTTIHKCLLPDYVEESIIINTLGDATINIDSNFSCSYNNIIIRSNNINISNKYIYDYLCNNIDKLNKCYKGYAIRRLDKDDLANLEIEFNT